MGADTKKERSTSYSISDQISYTDKWREPCALGGANRLFGKRPPRVAFAHAYELHKIGQQWTTLNGETPQPAMLTTIRP
jgi:hypothetical protein